jgi:hypothetical protein
VRKDVLFIGILLLMVIIGVILLIISMTTGQTPGNPSQTIYAVTSDENEYEGHNITPEMLYAPLNVSKLAYPFAYEIRKEPMRVEVAADLVRSFANDPSMDVTYQGNGSTYFGIVYDMRSGQNFFIVNPMTGQVFTASSSASSGQNVSISMDEARSIGTEYVRDHYKGFDSMKGMTITDSELNDHAAGGKDYTIIWHEYIDGVQTLNNANVVIDADSGHVTFYGGIDFPVPALLDHTISQEQATEIALSRIGNYNAGDLRAYLADNRTFNMTFLAEPSYGDGAYNATIINITAGQQFILDGNFTQHQAWNIIIDETRPLVIHDVDGDHLTSDDHRWWINVDASTGEIFSVDRCF